MSDDKLTQRDVLRDILRILIPSERDAILAMFDAERKATAELIEATREKLEIDFTNGDSDKRCYAAIAAIKQQRAGQ